MTTITATPAAPTPSQEEAPVSETPLSNTQRRGRSAARRLPAPPRPVGAAAATSPR